MSPRPAAQRITGLGLALGLGFVAGMVAERWRRPPAAPASTGPRAGGPAATSPAGADPASAPPAPARTPAPPPDWTRTASATAALRVLDASAAAGRATARVGPDEARAIRVSSGDILPMGWVVTNVQTTPPRVQVWDGGERILELRPDAAPKLLEQLKPAAPARKSGTAVGPKARALLEDLGADAAINQAIADALLGAGEAVVPSLIAATDDRRPIAGPVRIAGKTYPVRYAGDLIIGLLEAITGQTFGAPTGDRRTAVARAWQRWWGGSTE